MKKVCAVVAGVVISVSTVVAQRPSMDAIAAQYVRLALALGVHDADYVDAYHGPPEWRLEAERQRASLPSIGTQADVLLRQLSRVEPGGGPDDVGRLRHTYLTSQLRALRTKVAMHQGRKLGFDEESLALYGAVAPVRLESELATIVGELDTRVPGAGPLRERLERFRARFVIPPARLDATFRAAIDGCRTRTRRYIDLPQEEDFSVEYVARQSWSAYNWYQGNYRSVIQVNTDLPVRVEGAVDLACHEGYPGHHVHNVLLEKHLLRGRTFIEFSVYPLFSPQSLIAEGSANVGIDVVFPAAERLQFEREVIFPAAGLDPDLAADYYGVVEQFDRLSYAGNEAARRYLDGQIDAPAAATWLETYALMSPERAAQRIRFIDQYRSYVINYNVGRDMVRSYLEDRAGSDRNKTWREFERLLSTPRVPADLRER